MSAVLAKWLAKKAVLEQCRAKGIKVWWELEEKQVRQMANVYLNDHPELWAEARLLCAKLTQRKRR